MSTSEAILTRKKLTLFCFGIACAVNLSLLGSIRNNRAYAHAGLGHDSLSAISDHLSGDRSQAAAIIENARKRPGALSATQATVKCEERAARLSSSVHDASLKAVAHVNTLDTIFTGVQQYAIQANVKNAEYDAAHSTTTAAQTAANVDIGVMAVLNRAIDCSKSGALVDVIAYRIASKTAEQSIGTYRDSLLRLLGTLQGMK